MFRSPKNRWVLVIAVIALVAFLARKTPEEIVSAGELSDEMASQVRKFNVIKAMAENGEAISQSVLGLYYEKGEGVAKDYVEAYKWYSLPDPTWIRGAIEGRQRVVVRLTPEQIAEGKRRIAVFRAQNKSWR